MFSTSRHTQSRRLPRLGQTLRSADGEAWVVCGIRPSAHEGEPDEVELVRESDLHDGHPELIFSLTAPAFDAFCRRQHVVSVVLR